MKRKILMTFLSVLILGSLACGEGGSEFGNPDKISVGIIGYQSSLMQSFGWPQLTTQGLTIHTAIIVLDDMRFRPFDVCSGKQNELDEILLEGPFVIDLIQPSDLKNFESANIPTDTYCRVELHLKKLTSNIEGGDSIFGHSVLIEGERADGVPFRVTLDNDEKFKLENKLTGFWIDGLSGADQFFIAFDIDEWFQGVDLDRSPVKVTTDSDDNPIILIDDHYNKVLRDPIIDNLKRSADLFEDKDDDERLDVNEQEHSLAEGDDVLEEEDDL